MCELLDLFYFRSPFVSLLPRAKTAARGGLDGAATIEE